MRWVGTGLIMLLTLPAAGEEVYRWTDDHGRVHFGDRPAGALARPVELQRAPAPDAVAAERRERQQRLLDAFEQDRREAQEQAARARREEDVRRERCAHARDQARGVEEAGVVYELDAAGNRRYLSDGAREQALAQVRHAVERWCR